MIHGRSNLTDAKPRVISLGPARFAWLVLGFALVRLFFFDSHVRSTGLGIGLGLLDFSFFAFSVVCEGGLQVRTC